MSPESEGGFLLTKINHLSRRIFSRKLAEHDIEIGPGQGRIIFALWKKDRIPISELAAITSLGKSTLTDLLDRLDEVGLVRREKHPTDRRSLLIQLTEKAKNMRTKYETVSQEMTNLFYQGFSSEEIVIFERFLVKLLFNLTKAETEEI